MPPMNVPRSTPKEIADDPITSPMQLKPDDLADQRGASTADEQKQQQRKEPLRWRKWQR